MTRIEELKKLIAEIEDKLWWLSMADRWNAEDRDYNQKLTTQIIALKKELRTLEQ